MGQRFTLLVDGQATDGVGTFDEVNPATGEVFAQCPKADADLLDRAVTAASTVFPRWSALPIDEGAGLVTRPADGLEARAGEFANLLTCEKGKPLDQAMFEIMGSIYALRALTGMRAQTRMLKNDDGNKVIEHLVIDPNIPFRGSHRSGIGGELGQEGLNEYTRAHIVNSVQLEGAL